MICTNLLNIEMICLHIFSGLLIKLIEKFVARIKVNVLWLQEKVVLVSLLISLSLISQNRHGSLGKTESTKLMVSHIIHCSGDASDRELRNRIIEVRHRPSSTFVCDLPRSRLHHYWKHSAMHKHVAMPIPVDLVNIYN